MIRLTSSEQHKLGLVRCHLLQIKIPKRPFFLCHTALRRPGGGSETNPHHFPSHLQTAKMSVGAQTYVVQLQTQAQSTCVHFPYQRVNTVWNGKENLEWRETLSFRKHCLKKTCAWDVEWWWIGGDLSADLNSWPKTHEHLAICCISKLVASFSAVGKGHFTQERYKRSPKKPDTSTRSNLMIISKGKQDVTTKEKSLQYFFQVPQHKISWHWPPCFFQKRNFN